MTTHFFILIFTALFLLCLWPWLACAIVAFVGMKRRTWRRVLFAIALGPFALEVVTRKSS